MQLAHTTIAAAALLTSGVTAFADTITFERFGFADAGGSETLAVDEFVEEHSVRTDPGECASTIEADVLGDSRALFAFRGGNSAVVNGTLEANGFNRITYNLTNTSNAERALIDASDNFFFTLNGWSDDPLVNGALKITIFTSSGALSQVIDRDQAGPVGPGTTIFAELPQISASDIRFISIQTAIVPAPPVILVSALAGIAATRRRR